jgi:hypothetical protein
MDKNKYRKHLATAVFYRFVDNIISNC